MFIIHLRTNCHMPSRTSSLVVIVKMEGEEKFFARQSRRCSTFYKQLC